MTTPQRRLYRTLIRLHPADFRNRFGREMLLDFDDATSTYSALRLYLDALQSLVRQWSSHLLPAPHLPQPAHASLLSGQYIPLTQPLPSPFELIRAACIAAALFFSISFATAPHLGPAQIANAGLRSAPTSSVRPAPTRPGCQIPRLHTAGTTFATSSPAIKATWNDPNTEHTYEFNLWPAGIYALLLCLYFTLRNYLRKRRALRRGLFTAALVLAITVPLHPQILHAAAPLPTFDVASIRPWKRPTAPSPPPAAGAPAPVKVMKVDPTSSVERGQSSDLVRMILPIQTLIETAYNLPFDSRRITGGPAWVRDTDSQYEIKATISPALFASMQQMTAAQQHEQVRLMEQSLLADRFHLKLHFETRDMSTYELVIARGGPKLTPAAPSDVSMLANFEDEKGSGLRGTAVTLDRLIHSPLFLGGHEAVNKTGLTGAYNFSLNLGPPNADGDSTSLFTAIQEQLGLRLISAKSTVEIIVIDSVERPSEN
jgi:uncharacterized protein (TIGR03435 family)